MIRGEQTLGFLDFWQFLVDRFLAFFHIVIAAAWVFIVVRDLSLTNGRPVAREIAIMTAAVLVVFALHGLKVWLVMRRTTPEDRRTVFEIDEAGLRYTRDGAENTLPWSAITRVRERLNGFYVFANEKRGMFILKRVLAGGDRAALRALIAEKLGA